ncbi:hypothetical protein BaRGS_00014012 [Batillaria attramentaria]|uniref:Uncharacterized protein n=1 Tax=Batillaria attramentaria TaxID=370345 RepID=A0ABD0L5C6_9CAEN
MGFSRLSFFKAEQIIRRAIVLPGSISWRCQSRRPTGGVRLVLVPLLFGGVCIGCVTQCHTSRAHDDSWPSRDERGDSSSHKTAVTGSLTHHLPVMAALITMRTAYVTHTPQRIAPSSEIKL